MRCINDAAHCTAVAGSLIKRTGSPRCVIPSALTEDKQECIFLFMLVLIVIVVMSVGMCRIAQASSSVLEVIESFDTKPEFNKRKPSVF